MSLSEVSPATLDLINDFPAEYTHKVLKIALAVSSSNQDRSTIIEKLSRELSLPKYQVLSLLSVFIAITRHFLEASERDFITKLLEIGFTNKFIESLPLQSNKEEVVRNIKNSSQSFSHLTSIKWRIDISLGNSLLVTKVPKNVILTIVLNNKKYTIEADTKTFNQLRFNIALALKELSKFQKTFKVQLNQ